MMPAVSVAPVVAMVTRGAMTDLARTVDGLHDTAARHRDNGGVIVIGIVITIGVIVVMDAPNEEAVPVPEPVMEPVASKTRPPCKMADPCPTASASGAEATKATSSKSMSAATTTAAVATASAVATAATTTVHFDGQPVIDGGAAGNSGIDRRERFGALACGSRQHQKCHRGSAQQ